MGVEGTSYVRKVPLSADRVALEFRPFVLEVVAGPDRGHASRFAVRCAEVGSDPTCELSLTDATASRRHCRVEVTAEGYRVVDQGSRNGTRLDGCRVEAALLRPDVVLQVGSTQLRFSLEDRPTRLDLVDGSRFPDLVGRSDAMRHAFAWLDAAADDEAPLWLEGESGVGKELAAQAVHAAGPRHAGPIEMLDCAALREAELEPALFGDGSSPGMLAAAEGGTLVLHEPGVLPDTAQRRLLPWLERRAPGAAPARVVSLSLESLDVLVRGGQLRREVAHRIAVLRLRIPPLRHRLEDVPLLVDHFLSLAAIEGRAVPMASLAALGRLEGYSWPGNVPELRRFVERGMLAPGATDAPPLAGGWLDDLQLTPIVPQAVMERIKARSSTGRAGEDHGPLPPSAALPPYRSGKETLVTEWEVAYCRRVLDAHDGNVSAAARTAGLHRKSLEYLLRKHGIKPERG